MFLKNSRYYATETVETTDRAGRPVRAVKLRRLAAPASQPVVVIQGDQLDVIAERRYRDATRYWHIADANTELEANALVAAPGNGIEVPKS